MKSKSLLAIIIGVLIVFVLTGCFSKEAVTSETFSSKMQELGFTISDASSQFSNEEHVNKVLVARDSTNSFQLEFFDINTESNAIAVYNTNYNNMENQKGSMSTSSSVSMGNYNRATQESNGEYWVLSRIANTFIYVHTDSAHKQDANSALDALGY